ncbi:MAG: hypothetical protein EHM79_17915, partial [Geobacter sp.]
SYTGRLYTWGLVAWPGIQHIEGWDFSPVIDKALSLPGCIFYGGHNWNRRTFILNRLLETSEVNEGSFTVRSEVINAENRVKKRGKSCYCHRCPQDAGQERL